MLTNPSRLLSERRAMARAWLRLDPPARAQVPRPRVYLNGARNERAYANIARAMNIVEEASRLPTQEGRKHRAAEFGNWRRSAHAH